MNTGPGSDSLHAMQPGSFGDQDRHRALQAVSLPDREVDSRAWANLQERAEDDGAITVIEITRLFPGSAEPFDAFLQAVSAAVPAVGGSVLAVTEILEPGVGDLLGYMDFAGGVAQLLSFPSRAAYLRALVSDAWQEGLAARRSAARDVILLVAGENQIPPMAKTLFGEPRPASAFATPNIEGKSPQEIIDALLAVYPDGGADPTRQQLEVMMHYPGFRETPVHYVNLYAFGDGDDPTVKGAAAHDAYNQAALQAVLPHGGYPLLRAEVEHCLMSAIPWSRVIFVRWPSLAVFTDMRLDAGYIAAQKHRVESAETYGNFITVKRGDRASA